jgi:hypothetical protein
MVDNVRNQSRADVPAERPGGLLAVSRLLELLRLEGLGEAALLAGLFDTSDSWWASHTLDALRKDKALEALVTASPQACVLALEGGAAQLRAQFIRYLASHRLIGTGVVFDRVLRLAADDAKGTREAAMTALTSVERTVLAERASAVLAGASVDARLAAVRVLATIIGPPAAATLDAHAEQETTKKILRAIAEARQAFALLGAGAERQESAAAIVDDARGYVSIEGTRIEMPPMPALPSDGPLPPEAEQRLRAAISEAVERGRAFHAERVAAGSEHHKKYPFKPPIEPSAAADVVAVMRGETLDAQRLGRAFAVVRFAMVYQKNQIWAPVGKAFAEILAGPQVTLRHVVRLGSAASGNFNSMLIGRGPFASVVAKELAKGLDLRVLDMLVVEERKTGNLATDYLGRHHYSGDWLIDGDEFLRDQVWPWVASHFNELDQAFGLAPGSAVAADAIAPGLRRFYENNAVPRALELLALLPAPPRRYLQVLTDLATTGPKATRAEAREVLALTTNLTGLICGLLNSGEQARRVAASQWLGERGDAAAVPALRAALDKERTDHSRAALLSALARLGEDIAPYFADATLLTEAKKALPKLRSKLTQWFPLEALPSAHWSDGRPVPAEILRYWLLLADKLKQAGGNPMLHIGLDRLKRDDAERIGLFALATFLAHDTRCPSEQEANAHAEANADQRFQSISRWMKDYTRERAFADLKREKLGQYFGSANDHRGILALAHAPAVDAVAMVRGFFRDHGQRTAQCRALLECLAANPAPAALQFVLAVAKRYKTAGVQSHAAALIEAVAEANSWSADELADRTVPTGGFDETGNIEIAIRDRTYRLVLTDDCGIAIENPEGKTVASPPSPSGEAEAKDAKEAKKKLSAARKELAQALDLQRARLYEAMCCGRIWPVADFEAYLLGHPVMARLIRRLVFAGLDPNGALVGTFRPLDDGGLTDPADGAVGLSAFAGVKLAHRALLDDATAQGWRTHLADYEAKPLFEQFDRPVFAVAADDQQSEIVDRQGHMTTTFALRGSATKLGYQRGPGEGGGVFTVYQKRFESAGVTAVVAFTGSALPEENVACALRGLSFMRTGGGRGGGKVVALAKVPPVLLSEAWNDYQALAATGTGFDPQWERKAAF